MIIIRISTDEIVYDIRSKVHTELQVAVQDETARYHIESGTEKLDEVRRCIQESFAEVQGSLSRFLTDNVLGGGSAEQSYNKGEVMLPVELTLYFKYSYRRFKSKIESLTTLLFSLIVNLSMSRYYMSVNSAALSQARSAMAQSDLALIQSMLYYKSEPTITHVS